jgi:hypothetical protein
MSGTRTQASTGPKISSLYRRIVGDVVEQRAAGEEAGFEALDLVTAAVDDQLGAFFDAGADGAFDAVARFP